MLNINGRRKPSEESSPRVVLVPVNTQERRKRRWFQAPVFTKGIFMLIIASLIFATGGLGATTTTRAIADESTSNCTTLARATSVCIPQIISGGVKRPPGSPVTEETIQYMWNKQEIGFINSANWLDRTYPSTNATLLSLNNRIYERLQVALAGQGRLVNPTSGTVDKIDVASRSVPVSSNVRVVTPTVIPLLGWGLIAGGGALLNWGWGKATGTTIVENITNTVGGAVGDLVADQFDFLCFWSTPPDTEVAPKLDPWPGLVQTLSGYDSGGSGLAGVSPVGSLAATALSGVVETPNRLRTEDRLYTPGLGGEQSSAAQGSDPTTGRVTAFEWWGSAGQVWQSSNFKDIDGICAIGTITRQSQGAISNTVWLLTSTIAHVGILIFYYASIPDALEPFIGAGGPVDTVLQNSVNSLFLPFAIPMIFLVSFWVAWQGLFKRRSSEVLQGVLWTVLAGGLTIVFLSSPTTIINYGNGLINNVQSVIINVFGSAGSVASGGSSGGRTLCELGGTARPPSQLSDDEIKQIIGPINLDGSAKDPGQLSSEISAYRAQSVSPVSRWEGIRSSQCSLWSIFIFSPWARGQFGELAGTPVPGLTDDLKVKIAGAEVQGGDTFALVWLDSRTLNHDEALRARGTFPNAPLTEAEIEKKMKQQVAIHEALIGYKRALNTNDPLVGTPGFGSNPGERPGEPGYFKKLSLQDQAIVSESISVWSGDNGLGGRLSAALLSFVGVLAAGIPIMLLSFLLLMYQLITVVLIFLAPLFLLLGIHPGFGRKIALGWVEQILNISLKRIGVTLLIGILIMLIGIVMATAIPTFLQIILMGAFSIAILVFSKRILSTIARVDLNGNQVQDIEQAINDSTRKIGSATAGAAVGAATAGAGGAGGAGMAKAAGSGGVGGFSSGSMMGGVTSGTGAGMSVAANERQEREETEQEEQRTKTAQEKQEMIELLDEMRDSGASREELADLRGIFQEFGLEEATKEAQRIRGTLRESDRNAERRHEDSEKEQTGGATGAGGAAGGALATVLQNFGNGSGEVTYSGEGGSTPTYNGVEIQAWDLAANPEAYPEEIHDNEVQQNSGYRDTYIYGLAAMDQGYTDMFSKGVENSPAATQKREAQLQKVMEYSDESNAVQWEQYARNSRKSIPEPQNPKLKEILEEAGVQFIKPINVDTR